MNHQGRSSRERPFCVEGLNNLDGANHAKKPLNKLRFWRVRILQAAEKRCFVSGHDFSRAV